MKKILIFICGCFALVSTYAQCNHAVVGYWQSWSSNLNPVYNLANVSCAYNVVDVAFLANASASDPTMSFPLDTVGVESTAQFIADVKTLQNKGVTVIASIGGANATITIPDTNSMNDFVNSLIVIIDKYGFNGIDLDIENGITLNSGDNDYTNSTTPTIVNLITAMKRLKTKYGSKFYITMAPQVANVQGGISAYSGIWGCYLPIIYGLRNELNYIYVQYYNTGSSTANDGKNYTEGTADFIVAMTDMLLSGFTMYNGQKFIPLLPTQVAFGLPATSGAASGGYTSTATIEQALSYLTKGTSYGGQYVLSNNYPSLAGIMTWSTNWDSSANYSFAKTFSQYFCSTTDFCGTTTNVNTVSTALAETGTIYPNPSSCQSAVSLSYTANGQSVTIEVYDINGRLLKQLYKGDETGLNCEQLSMQTSGTYIVKLLNGKEVQILEWVVN